MAIAVVQVVKVVITPELLARVLEVASFYLENLMAVRTRSFPRVLSRLICPCLSSSVVINHVPVALLWVSSL